MGGAGPDRWAVGCEIMNSLSSNPTLRGPRPFGSGLSVRWTDTAARESVLGHDPMPICEVSRTQYVARKVEDGGVFHASVGPAKWIDCHATQCSSFRVADRLKQDDTQW